MSNEVSVREVGLRDGLQLVKSMISTEVKLQWIREQAACGFREIEVTSFVPPKVIPQFADAADVLQGSLKIPGMRAGVLVPNLKGAIRALDNDAQKINFVISASEAHNKANVKRTVDESVAEFTRLVEERDARGLKGVVELNAGIATAFGCTIQGEVPEKDVFALAERLERAGADEMNVADTVGYASPMQVKRILSEIGKRVAIPLVAHFHDTRGMGLANVVAALEAGVRRFDSALGGTGGCPFAPGASGNIATEDCIYLLQSSGFKTGVNLDALLALRSKLPVWLPGETLNGCIGRAGVAKNFEPSEMTS
ncbi:MAG: hydroxymethylglutaryl-CoA lyase [Burkholderiaceae bacterium]